MARTPAMSLSRLILSFPMERAGYAQWTIAEDAAAGFAHMDRLALHYVLSGSLVLTTADGDMFDLETGSFVCVARGAAHRISVRGDAVAANCEWLRDLSLADEPDRHIVGAAIPAGRLLSASVALRASPASYTVPTLPPFLIRHVDGGPTSTFAPPPGIDALLAGEGGSAFAAGLLQALLAQAVRSALAESDIARSDEIHTFRFPRIASACRMLERYYPEPWTVGSLAAAAGMARSTFIAAFVAATGETPSARLTNIRLSEARRLLGGTRTIGEIAQAVGYHSQTAFTRAFRRKYGEAPTDVRRAKIEAEQRQSRRMQRRGRAGRI